MRQLTEIEIMAQFIAQQKAFTSVLDTLHALAMAQANPTDREKLGAVYDSLSETLDAIKQSSARIDALFVSLTGREV